MMHSQPRSQRYDAPTVPTAIATGVTTARLAHLRRWNLGLVALHVLQAIAVLVLASDFAITITSTFPQGPPGTPPPAPAGLVDVPIGVAVALFLGLAAVDHLVTATVARGTYEGDLRRGINRFRWGEYSLSATLMVLLIASYSGITDFVGDSPNLAFDAHRISRL
jgi:hypothetical protein